MSGSKKVIVVGLEVGDGKLIQEWSREGHLPVFNSLIQDGSWHWLETPAEVLHVSAWPSIYTGTSPGQHGVYFTFQPAPGIQGYKRFETGLYGRPTFWRLLSDDGYQCTVLDAPYTHFEEGFTGTQVFDWGTWAKYLGPMSVPPTILRRLGKKFGKDPIGLEAHDIGLAAVDAEDMTRRLVDSVRARTDAVGWLMDETAWDLFFFVFGETHPAAHYCWAPPSVSVAGDGEAMPMRRVYEEIDRGLGQILSRLGSDTTVLLVSGDGVGPNHSGWHLMPEILRRSGYLAEPSVDEPQSSPAEGDTGRRDPVKMIRDLLPKDLRKSIARQLPRALRDKLAQRVDTATIDWAGTRAYCLPTDLEGCIRINLRGREPQGVVAPGAEYEELCTELASSLQDLVDVASGRPAVDRVVRTDQVFPGPRSQYLPDLIVLWSREETLTAVGSDAIGVVEAPSPDERPGTHSPPGFLLARGTPVTGRSTVDASHVYDVAPTILSLFDVPVPAHMIDKTIKELEPA